MDERENENLDIPEELYAPMGNVTFEKPESKKNTEPEILSYKNVKLEYAEKPFNKKKFITTIVTLILIIVTVLISYFYITNKKIILKRAFESIADRMETTWLEVKNNPLTHFSEDKPFKTSLLVSFDTTYDENNVATQEKNMLDTLSNIKLSEVLQIDHNNQQLTHNFKSKYLGNNILFIRGNGTKKTVNYKILEVVGKYIEFPVEGMEFVYRDIETEQKLLSEICNNFIKLFMHIPEKDLSQTKTQLKIGDNNYNIKKTSLTLNKNDIKTLLNKSVKESNYEIRDSIIEYLALSEDKYQQYLKTIENELENLNNLKIEIFSKGIKNQILGIKITIKSDKNYILTYLEDVNNLILAFGIDEQNILTLGAEKTNNEIKSININTKNSTTEIDKYREKGNIAYQYNIENPNKETIKGNLIFQTEENKFSKTGNIRISIIKTEEDGEEIYNIQTSLNYSVETLEKIELYDDTEKIQYNSISAANKKEIKKKLETSKYFALVRENIEAYMNYKK